MIYTIIGSLSVMTMMVVVVTFSTSTRVWKVSPASVSFAGKAVRKEGVKISDCTERKMQKGGGGHSMEKSRIKIRRILKEALTSETLFSLVVRVTAAPLCYLSSH
jgi:hypothetical protein